MAVDYLLTYPLIFACSIINLNGHSAFKQEFIIPQLLMQWVYRNYTEIKGIKYFSCNKSDEFLQYHGYNIVMPAIIDKNRKKYSKDLSQKFKVSKPSLVIYQFSDTEIIKVKKYKDDLLTLRSSIFSEAFDCLCKLYYVTSLLDCAIQDLDSTNTRLLISAVQNVRLTGYIIYEKYPIEDILEKGRASMLYTEQTEAVMEIFSTLYARFRPDVIDVAESFLKRINRPIQHIPDEFYTI